MVRLHVVLRWPIRRGCSSLLLISIITIILLTTFLLLSPGASLPSNHDLDSFLPSPLQPEQVSVERTESLAAERQPLEPRLPQTTIQATTTIGSLLVTSVSVGAAAFATAIAEDKVIVTGKLSSEDTSWVVEELSDWQNAIYTVDDQNATLHTPINKGREALPYLLYIIDHYNNLPSTIAFVHSHKDGFPEAWHTDNPEYSNVRSLRDLQIPFIQSNGYANLRCNPAVGCPDEVRLDREEVDESRKTEVYMPQVWPMLFQNETLPDVIATPCCAQFAVSKEQVLRRPHEDYRRYLQWLMDTKLDDGTSGRIFEYLWHIIFGRQPVYCPDIDMCYCQVYGRC